MASSPSGVNVSALSANFEIYPRLDVISRVIRWQLDKRRWHLARIKSRADVSCSNRKAYMQKGFGRARHATAAVCQFRGGGKYAAKKAYAHLRLNKKFKSLAMRSCLSLKRASHSLFVLDSFSQLKLLAVSKPLVIYYSVSEIRELTARHARRCVHWSNLSVTQIIQARELVFAIRALKMLDAKLCTSEARNLNV
ncbi:MAG: 50S ribosomal protein L4 [Candidatus Hodgkinia cicadicola]